MGRHRLAARRIVVGLTQEGLAERLDVAVSTVARWEQGATAPRALQRGRLADALGLTLHQLDELLGRSADEPVAVPLVSAAPGVTARAALPAVAAPEVAVDEPSSARPPAGEVPRVAGFVGRAAQVDEIATALERERVVVVVGRRGVGTSACAWEGVHLGAERGATRRAFYADLRPRGRPVPVAQVLADLARRLGAEAPPQRRGDAKPPEVWGPLRQALSAVEALLIVDNVDDHDAVRMLVPLPEPCRLLVIGSPTLVELRTAHHVELEELPEQEAATLFESTSTRSAEGALAPRADPTVRELVDLCGRQPRAIGTLAREIASGPLNLVGSLETLRLAVGAPPHQTVRFFLAPATVAAQDAAYAALGTSARLLFRRLGLVPEWLGREAVLETSDGDPRVFSEGELSPGPLALEAMARLAGRSIRRTEDLVAELSHGKFIRPVPSVASAEIDEGSRYEIRPLLAPSARLHLRRDEPAWRRVRAQVRLVRYLARKAGRHAARPSLAGREWFACHEQLLAAVVAMATSRTGNRSVPLPRPLRRWWFKLAQALCLWYAAEDRLDEWWVACEAVQRAPMGRRPPLLGRLGNELGTLRGRPPVEGWVLNERGVILRRRGDARAAIAELTKALVCRGRRGEAQVLTNRGLAFLDLGAVDTAIADLKRAAKRRAPRDKVGLGLTELGLGVAYLRSGAASDARRHLVKAADAFDRAKDLRGSAAARTNLVLAEWETGAHNAAMEAGTVALEKYAELEQATGWADSRGHAAALLNMGVAAAARPDRDHQPRAHRAGGIAVDE